VEAAGNTSNKTGSYYTEEDDEGSIYRNTKNAESSKQRNSKLTNTHTGAE